MQKIYERINWENDPSTKTAINEDNLNKMDYAIDEIDSRVVKYSKQYEAMVEATQKANTATSNANTATSKANTATANANSVAEFALSAAEEANNSVDALKGALEGTVINDETPSSVTTYSSEKIEKLDIQTTTDYILPNSKKGGYRLLELHGNTEQKKLSGKNLFNATLTDFQNASAIGAGKQVYFQLKPNTKYTCSTNAPSVDDATSNTNIWFNGMSGLLDGVNANTSRTTTTDENGLLYIIIRTDFLTNFFSNYWLQLEEGETATPHEPYLGGVELFQGGYSSSTGAILIGNKVLVGTKQAIPCSPNDNIKIKLESALKFVAVNYYNGSTFVSSEVANNVSDITFTVPSGVNNLHITLQSASSESEGIFITPESVGAVSLTVNGKPIYVHAGGDTGGMTSPSQYYPQAIKNTFDVVEMIKGDYQSQTGVFRPTVTGYVSSKNFIPCKSGDVLKIATEITNNYWLYYFDDNGFIKTINKPNMNEVTETVPSGVTKFVFCIGNASTTVDNVGKITLTINGKYVGCVKGHGKNFWKYGDVSGTTAVANLVNIPSGIYTLSALVTSSDTDNATCRIIWGYSDGTSGYAYMPRGTTRTNVKVNFEKEVTRIDIYASQNTNTSSNDTFTFADIQLEQSEVMTDYEPYQETVAYFLMNEPLRANDVLCKENGLHEVKRGTTEIVFDSNTPSNHIGVLDDGLIYINYAMTNLEPIDCTHFTKYPTQSIVDNATAERWLLDGQFSKRYGHAHERVYFRHSGFTSVDDVLAYLASNSIIIVCETTEPTIEVLDQESQRNLNALETFDMVTYIEVDSRVQPLGIEAEYGTSQVGAYTLKCMNDNDTDKVERAEMKARLDELAVALVSQ